MSRGRARGKRTESATAKGRTRANAPVRPAAGWQAGNQAISRVLGKMQEAFREDFSGVQIDSSARAREQADGMGATAVTSGNTIMLGPSAPPLESERGQQLLAHELTHVVQQRHASDVDEQAVSSAGDSFERDAEQSARLAPLGRPVNVPVGGATPGTQRQDKPGATDEELKKIKENVQKAAPAAPVQAEPLETEEDKARKQRESEQKKSPDKGPLPRRKKTISDVLGKGRETEGKRAPDPTQTPDRAGTRDVGKEADAAIHTVLFPGLPLHELYYRTLGKTKPPIKPSEDKTPADAQQKSADPATQALRNNVEGKMIQAMGRAQSSHSSMAMLDLDAGLEPQREAIAAMLDAVFEEARDKIPFVPKVMVSIGGKFVKTLSVPEKK